MQQEGGKAGVKSSMNRSQAVVISVLIGLVTLTLFGLALVVFFPVDRFFVPFPPPTVTLAPPATPTFPNFMPTPGAVTPTPGEPTPTGTRVPTSTSAPPQTPQPTLEFSFGTPFVRPSATSVPLPPAPPATATPTLVQTPTPNVRLYQTEFKVEDSTLQEGACTDLVWRTDGPVTVTLDGESVGPSGRKKVCPERDTTYEFTTQISGSPQIDRHLVRVAVESGD